MNIRLLKPLKGQGIFKTNVVELVTLRAPKMRDLVGIDFTPGAGMVTAMVELLARCSNLSKDQLLDLETTDFNRLVDEVSKFMSAPGASK